jgi:hypothetical protein
VQPVVDGRGLLPAPAAAVASATRDEFLRIRFPLDDFPEPRVSSAQPTLPQAIRKGIPGFFVVIGDEEPDLALTVLEVKAEASYALTNPTIRTIKQVVAWLIDRLIPRLFQGTIVFASEFITVPLEETSAFSVVWLHLPDGWIPFERYERVSPSSQVFTPLVRPYSPIVNKRALLGETVPSDPPSLTEAAAILPRSASSLDRSPNYRTRDPAATRRDIQARHGMRSRHQSSPSSISRAILKAKEDISALTHSLRETSEQAKVNRSRPPLPPPYMASASGGKSTPSDRVMRLIAMQQQIDMLSSSIIEIQESLSGVRLGLAAALAGKALISSSSALLFFSDLPLCLQTN